MAQEITFTEAVQGWLARRVLPTGLDSAGIAQQISAAVRRQSVFSAETLERDYLTRIQEIVESVVNPKQVTRADEEGRPLAQTVTEGFHPATARVALKDKLAELGYEPGEGIRGTIKDLSSDGRLDLVIDTNVKAAHGAGRFIQQNLDPDVVDLWPALEFVRFEEREEPRDWEQRWRIAASVAGDAQAAAALELHGRMAALKSSEIWEQLGEGAGGYLDTLGNPYPPFAFRSGMWTEELSRDEAVELGLLEEGEKAEPAEFDLGSLFGTPE